MLYDLALAPLPFHINREELLHEGTALDAPDGSLFFPFFLLLPPVSSEYLYFKPSTGELRISNRTLT